MEFRRVLFRSMFAGEPAPVDANRSEAPTPITTSDAQLETVIDSLMDKVSIDQINKSNLLTVVAYSADAAKAQRIANKFVSVTINRQISKRRAATRETSELPTKDRKSTRLNSSH